MLKNKQNVKDVFTFMDWHQFFSWAQFIHSFIQIERLYSTSSRKLLRSAPNTSTVKQSSLKVRKNAGEMVLLKMQSSEGRPFQVEGPTTEKARICLVEVRVKGTRRRPCWDERSDRELIALRGGQQSSHR